MATKKIGDWIVIKTLTEDTGSSTTHLVNKEGDDHRVKFVLKQIKGTGPFDNRKDRFRTEIDAGMRLTHLNITHVIASNLDDGKPFIVTEYCEGGSLKPASLIGKTLIERLNIFRGICEGIAHAHSKGVVHRDLKPDNIFLHANGSPVIGDFGLCFFLDDDQERITHLDEAVGARWYMAPECEGGRAQTVAPTADVYSLGKVLYWMMAGRIFSRERHHDFQYDLRRNQPSSDLVIVYKLLDQMIQVNPATRLKDGTEVLSELNKVIRRINSRRRVFDLSGTSICIHDRHEVRIISFRPGSIVTNDLLDTTGFQMMGFRVRDHNQSLWGYRLQGHESNEVVLFTTSTQGSWRSSPYKTAGRISQVRGFGNQTLALDGRGNASVVVTEGQVSGQERKILLVTAGSGSDVTTLCISDGVGVPRYHALAFGPSGEIAVYSANDEPLLAGIPISETFVKQTSGLDRHPIPAHTNFLAPLAFDQTGKLHQAVVTTVSVGTQEVRHLVYITREVSGVWTELTIDSTAGDRIFPGATIHGRMSASISLGLKPDGTPVILGNSSRCSTTHLVIYFIESGSWQIREIDLEPIAASFGLYSIETGGLKQLLFDTYLENKEVKTRSHLALFTNQDDLAGVLYVILDEKWNLVDQRYLPAKEFFGMGIDEYETVYLALR